MDVKTVAVVAEMAVTGITEAVDMAVVAATAAGKTEGGRAAYPMEPRSNARTRPLRWIFLIAVNLPR